MDRQSGVIQRSRQLPFPHSTSIQLRYERERCELQKQITQQLVSDVFGLYEKSLLVDLKIETSRGNVYCHQLFLAARVPSLWRLLREIAKFQHQPRVNASGAHHSLVCVHLPDVEYRDLQKFVRGLYSEVVESGCGALLRRQLEETLGSLQQAALLQRHQLRIERLTTQEEQRVQHLLLKQLRLGKFSARKGDVGDVERAVSAQREQPRNETLSISAPKDEFRNERFFVSAQKDGLRNERFIRAQKEQLRNARLLVNAQKEDLRNDRFFISATKEELRNERLINAKKEDLRDVERILSIQKEDLKDVERLINTQKENLRDSERILSLKKGDIRDIERIVRGSDGGSHGSAFSETDDSSSAITIRHLGSAPKSVRPKSSQWLSAQGNSVVGNTMNITNHSGTGIDSDVCDIKVKPKTGMSEEVLSLCGSNIGESVGSVASQLKNGKIPLRVALPTKRTPNDDPSPSGQLSNQESPVFNVSMIKELQTSPMQVSGESFQDKLKRESSPSSSQRSSNSESTTPVDPLQPLQDDNKKGVVYSNGDTGFLFPEGVTDKNEKPHKYGAMFSTKENAVLHQANALAQQQLQHQHSKPSVSAAKKCMQRKSLSFSAESQDSTDLENTSVSNSGSDHRLCNLHETSSLEVELPSSHEENSSSHESDESPAAAVKKWESDRLEKVPKQERSKESKRKATVRQRQGVVNPGDPSRRLVRARTFEILEKAVDTESPHEDSKHEEQALPLSTRPVRDTSGESLNSYHGGFKASRTNIGGYYASRDNPGSGDGRKISDESTSSYHESDDPERLREMERKKGSLIFEHNFQTYSNIPTTNMMTASMMTASMSSESGSVGMGSLYSSMMDSALMGSIHSLGTLEQTIVDPIPRPASVGLPIMHSREEINPDIARIAARIPATRDQLSTDEMILELQQEMAKRGPASNFSPSPDSLNVDSVARREAAEAREKEKQSKKAVSRKASSEASSVSLNKEEMDNEEKERDERENDSKSSDSSAGTEEGKTEKKEITSEKKVPSVEDFSQKAFRQMTGSPRLSRDLSENTPIVSGGSTLKREKDHGDRSARISRYERQVSTGSVKDVDSIPLVCGYFGPQDDDEMKKEMKEEAKAAAVEKEDEKQSIFPMFIDLKDIPTPTEEKKPIEKPKPQSSAVYMYIEADSPSPKTRKKRRSESDGSVLTKSTELQAHAEFTSLPPVLGNAAPSTDDKPEKKSKRVSQKEEDKEAASEEGVSKEKKAFFMFIEAESSPKVGSPKLRKRPVPPPKKKPENSMTRSAPSDSLLFSSAENSSKLMTKSVIDREEFNAQPPTRKNVSLNDKINESSSSRDGSFVSGIPRPIHTLKNKVSKSGKVKPSPRKRDSSTGREPSATQPRDDLTTSETNEMATSRDVSASELGTSLSVSFSEALPSGVPLDCETSEVSDVSSLLSSIDRSNDQPEEGKSGKSENNSKLGNDLLRMFLNEINTDVTIQIGEKRIRAHKCILASRCVYFAAMLSGHWVESAGNVIKLQGFSAECVVVALKHIYSGSSTVPEGVRVGELAALADMLALDGLKDVISLHLKAKMCHYFHKPCAGCLEGVLEVVPIAGAYCLDDMYHRCLRWVAKHFVVVLPTRNYAALPSEVQDRCLKQLLDDMSVSSVVDTALGCERVLGSLPMVRWAQPVFDSAAQLLEAGTTFIAANMCGVLASDRFLSLGGDSGWSINSLQDTMRVACELIRPDQAVLSHLQLSKILEQNPEDGLDDVSETFLSFVENLLKQVEKFMIHNANRVAVCRKWPLLSSGTQRRIKDAALVVVEFSRPTAPRPKLSSATRRVRGSNNDGGGGVGCRPGEHRLMRSASASAVPASQRSSGARRPPQVSGQDPTRTHTPPPTLSRPRPHTPPPTRASTLRAQARQAAIQRSQSARTVCEKPPRRTRQGNDNSTDEDTQSSNKRATPVSGFTRGATFTRSLSRPEPSTTITTTTTISTISATRALPHTPTRSAGPPSSRPRTPGVPEPSQLPRRTLVNQRTSSHTTTGSSASEDEIPLRKSTSSQDQSRSEELGNNTKMLASKSSESEGVTPPPRSDSRSSNRAGRPPQDSKDSGGRTPRTPRADKGDQLNQIDVRNGNVTRTRAALGRRGARSPMRDLGRTSTLTTTARGTISPTPAKLSASLTECRSRSSSMSSKLAGSTSSLSPAVASRSNTFCKDDNSGSTKRSTIPVSRGRESVRSAPRKEWENK